MTRAQEIADIERRAAAVRTTMRDLCALAGINKATWHRAKNNPDSLRVKKLGALEDALVKLETQRAEA